MKMEGDREKRLEALLWSIAFPGFGQLLHKQYTKALLFIVLEIIINVCGKINTVIVASFLLDTSRAIQEADYLWLMFYPCIYLFAMWDAYRDAGGKGIPFMHVPFVMAAYTGTLGVIYSKVAHIGAFYFGPVFLPILTMAVGFVIGRYIQKRMRRKVAYEA